MDSVYCFHLLKIFGSAAHRPDRLSCADAQGHVESIPKRFSDDLIHSVYKSLTQNAHHDFKPVDVDDTIRMKAINGAYEGLSNPDLKAAYPRSLDQNLGMIPLLRGGRQRPNLQDLKQPSIPGLLNDLR